MLDRKTKQYFENPKRIVAVKTDDNYNLILTFDSGEVRLYSMQNELDGVFSVLKDKNKFQTAFVNEFGNVAWNIDTSVDSKEHWENQIDLCKDALYMDSVPITLISAEA